MIPVSSAPSDPAQLFLAVSSSKLIDDFLPRLEKALEVIPDKALWTRDGATTNSVGNLLLHTAGNLRQWVIAGVGGAEDTRDRASEFTAGHTTSKDSLTADMRRTVREASEIIAAVPAGETGSRRSIQGYDTTVLEAIYHAVEHFSYHLGQIIHLAKHISSKDLRFYEF